MLPGVNAFQTASLFETILVKSIIYNKIRSFYVSRTRNAFNASEVRPAVLNASFCQFCTQFQTRTLKGRKEAKVSPQNAVSYILSDHVKAHNRHTSKISANTT